MNTRQQSLTRAGGAGQGNIFSSTHSTRTPLHTKGQQTERQWKVIEVKVIQLSTAAHKSPTSLPNDCYGAFKVVAALSEFCDICDAELVTRHMSRDACHVPDPPSPSQYSHLSPRSLLSLSPSDEALAVSVINLPPDINLFQLLRVRPGLNKHTGHNPVSGITCPLSPPPGTGQPTERIIIYD